MKRILGPLVLVGVLTAATVGRAQWWPFGSGDRDEIADLRVEVAELQMTERRLLEENAALTATNQTLQSELNRVRDSEVEVERLRGDLARALSDLVGSRARTEEVRNQLSTSLTDNARLRERLRAALDQPPAGPPPSGGPWLVFGVVFAIAAVLVWRELWWRSQWVISDPPRVVDAAGRALAQQGPVTPATRPQSSKRSASDRR